MRFGEVELSWLGHDGFIVDNESLGKRIAIDPYETGKSAGKVDIVLVTHEHYDHCSVKDIQNISRVGTKVIGPAHIQSAITKVENVELHVVEVGDVIDFGDFKIEAVPAYCLNKYRDASNKTLYHPKSEGYLGYLIKMGNIVIYHAGDSDLIPEMRKLTGYGKQGNSFIVLLPVSGKYAMDAEEAAEAAALLKPTLAVPMHYGSVAGTLEDAQRFINLCDERGVSARMLEKI